MESAPRNTHEQVYIDMSIIVIDAKKKCFVVASIWLVECIPSLRNNLWCYPTLRVLSIFGVTSLLDGWMLMHGPG